METFRSGAFFSLIQGEQLLAELEVLDQQRGWNAWDTINFARWLLLPIVGMIVLIFLRREFSASELTNLLILNSAVLGLPLLIFLLWAIIFRRERNGCVVVTTERLGYYESWRNFSGAGHLVFQVHLQDVYGINGSIRSTWREDRLYLTVVTAHGDGYIIASRRTTFPLLAWLDRPSTGRDAYAAPQMLFGLVDAVRPLAEARA